MQPFLRKKSEKRLPRLRVPPVSAAVWALLLLAGGRNGTAGAIAALLHEAGHLAAMRFTGSRAGCITLLPLGVSIEREPGVSSYRDDFLVCAGGIAVNLCMLLLSAALPFPASFRRANLAHALFSILPLPPLDGEGMLRALLSSFLSPVKTARILFAVSLVFYVPLLFFALWLLWEKDCNPTLLLLCVALGGRLFFDRNTDA